MLVVLEASLVQMLLASTEAVSGLNGASRHPRFTMVRRPPCLNTCKQPRCMGQSGVPESPERGVTLAYQRVRNESCWLPGLNRPRPQAQSLHVLLAFNADAQARKYILESILNQSM